MARIVEWREWEAQWAGIPDEGRTEGQVGCEPTKAVVYAGHGVTDANGQWKVSLDVITCGKPNLTGRPSIVAMPTWDTEPTARLVPIVMGAQLMGTTITVYSHYPHGAPAENVPFSWHCVIEFQC